MSRKSNLFTRSGGPRHEAESSWLKTPLDRFVRGGQTINLQVRETIHLIKIMSIVALLLGLGVFGVWIWATTTGPERASALAFAHVQILSWMQADPTPEFACPQPGGGRVVTELQWCLVDPAVSAGWRAVLASAERGAWVALGMIAAVFLFLGIWFKRFGHELIRERRTRGAEVVSGALLSRLVQRLNLQRAKQPYFAANKPYKLAGIDLPLGDQHRHIMACGTTGTGKSQLLFDLMAQIRASGDRAVVFDKTGAFTERFYDPDRRDIILNPLDGRCADWSLLAEARTDTDFDTMARALIPEERGQDRFWSESARSVFSTACAKFKSQGITDTRHVADFLLRADANRLNKFFAGTPAARSISSELGKTSANIMAVLAPLIRPLTYLPDRPSAPVAIRDWIGDDSADSCLFLTARADQVESLRGLLTLWFDTAIKSLLSLDRAPGRTVWFILDEFAALHRIPSLKEGLQEGRQYGAAFVLGIQSSALVKDVYGNDLAQALTGLCRTKVIFATGDYTTARECADWIGQAETQRAEQSMTYGPNDVRDAIGVHSRTELTHIVLPEQIHKLPDLAGFLSLPQDLPVGAFKIAPHQGEKHHPAFVAPLETPPDPQPSDPQGLDRGEGSETPAAPADKPKPRPPEQTEAGLPLFEADAGALEAPPKGAQLGLFGKPGAFDALLHKKRRKAAKPDAKQEGDSEGGGMAPELGDVLKLAGENDILETLLEEDADAERTRRKQADRRLEEERRAGDLRQSLDRVRRDQIDIALPEHDLDPGDR